MFREFLLQGLKRYSLKYQDSELKASIAFVMRIFASRMPCDPRYVNKEDIILYISPEQLIVSSFESLRTTTNDNWIELARIGYLMAAKVDHVPNLADPNEFGSTKSQTIEIASDILAEIFHDDHSLKERILAYFHSSEFGIYQAFYAFMQKSGPAIRQLVLSGRAGRQGQHLGHFGQTQLQASYNLGLVFLAFERESQGSIKFVGDGDDISFFSYTIEANDTKAADALPMITEVSRLCPGDAIHLAPFFPDNESSGEAMVSG